MGMSASQARLLSLTSRLSDLEYQAQSISNCKIRLADSSANASKDYEDALDAQKLQVKDSDTSTYVDASAYNLTTYGAVSELDKQRFLCDNSGKVLISQKVSDAHDSSSSKTSKSNWLVNDIDSSDYYEKVGKVGYDSLNDFLDASGVETDSSKTGYDASKLTYYTNLYNGKEDFLNSMGYTSASESIQKDDPNYELLSEGNTYTSDKSATTYYSNVYDRINKDGSRIISDSVLTDTQWLYEQLKNGNVFLSEWSSKAGSDGKGDWESVSYASGDTSISSVSDTSQVAKAEAKYDTVNAQIQAQDNRYDLELKCIDTEHNAIQQEIESVKKVIDKNIERTFKIFDA